MARTEGSIKKSWSTTANVLYTRTLTPQRTSSHFCVSYVQKSTFVCRAKHRWQVAELDFYMLFVNNIYLCVLAAIPCRLSLRNLRSSHAGIAPSVSLLQHIASEIPYSFGERSSRTCCLRCFGTTTLCDCRIAKIAQPRAAMPFSQLERHAANG